MFSPSSLESFVSECFQERKGGTSLATDFFTGLSRYIGVLEDGSFVCTFSLKETPWVSFYSDGRCRVHGVSQPRGTLVETSLQLREFLLATLPFPPAVRARKRLIKRIIRVADRHAWAVFNYSGAIFNEDEAMGVYCSAG